MGCSDPCSSAAATASACARVQSASTSSPSRESCPRVSVPVLSNTTCVTRASASIAWPRVTITPRRARLPTAAASAVGVASDSAHGQVTTSTATAVHSARAASVTAQYSAVAAATARTAATNHPAMRSAISTTCGRCAAARSVSRRICEARVASPARCTRITAGFKRLTAPAAKPAPARLTTGRLSPVSSASSVSVSPSTKTPSAGIASPGFTSTRSPGCKVTAATSSVARLAG